MAPSKKVPALRFQEFNEKWETKKVGELCDYIVPGRNKPKSFIGDIPWITTPDVEHNGTIEASNSGLSITKQEAKTVGSRVVPINSVVISCVGELGLVAITGKEVVINQQLHAFLPSENVISRFLLYSLSLRKDYMWRVATKTAVPYLNKDNCNSIPVSLPSLKEQQKIASFLTAVDDKIQQLTKKKALLQQYKKGVMQQIFSRQIRFKDEKGNNYPKWEEKKLGDILDYEQPTKYLVKSTEYKQGLETPVLTAGKTFILGYTNEKDGIFSKALPVILFDDFTTDIKLVDFSFKAKSSAIKILSSKKNVNIRFVYAAMQLIIFKIGGHGRHWISQYSLLKIPFPSIEEQNKIADFLTSINKKIEQVGKQLEQTQSFKKGLLQQMFV